MKKDFTAMFLTFALFASSADVYGAGLKINEDGTSEVISDSLISDKVEIISEPVDITEGITAYSVMPFAETGSDQGYFYDQLNDLDKQIYDTIDSEIDLILDGTIDKIEFVIPDQYNIYLDKAENESEKDRYYYYDENDNEIDYNLTKAIFTYLGYDHIEYFWLNNKTISLGIGYNQVSNRIGSLIFLSGNSKYAPPYDASSAPKEIEKVDSRTNDIITDIPDNATRYKKLQIINDWLVDNNTYNPYVAAGDEVSYNKANKVAWMLTSALLYGNGNETAKYPVCEGYAEAFKFLCDSMDIPCIIVTSKTHEWNAVQMDDGKWYYVDVTFNDPIIIGDDEDKIKEAIEKNRYKHFLIGGNNQNIVNDKDHIVSLYEDLELPVSISEYDYIYSNTGDADMDGYLTEADAALMLKDISGISKMTAEQSASGDIDGDGEITLVDVTKLLEKIG